MRRVTNDYSDFVEHPRFGLGPRFTKVRPCEPPPGYRLTTYISRDAIAGTAVKADLEKQSFSPVPVLYYFDLKRECLDCGRPFIFFAEEQKHWYETLGFNLGADCVRCIDCRKQQHGHERRRYEALFHRDDRSPEEDLEMVECSITLMEAGLFGPQQTERVRSILKRVTSNSSGAISELCAELLDRAKKIEEAHNRDQRSKEDSGPTN